MSPEWSADITMEDKVVPESQYKFQTFQISNKHDLRALIILVIFISNNI